MDLTRLCHQNLDSALFKFVTINTITSPVDFKASSYMLAPVLAARWLIARKIAMWDKSVELESAST